MAIGSRVTIKKAIRRDSDSSGFSLSSFAGDRSKFLLGLCWGDVCRLLSSIDIRKETAITEIDGRDYHVRQMKNLKASIPIEWLNFYAWACGALQPLLANSSWRS